jgi:flagellin
MLSVLNNISAMYAENNLDQTQASLQKTLTELSSGSRINSGADDAAGLAIAVGLTANQAALTQSASNANDGVSLLQTADGALSQVSNLLNRVVTLATEAANGGLTTSQIGSANQEYQNILTEIGDIGSTTNFNAIGVFSGTATDVVVSDGSSAGTITYADTVGALTTSSVGTTSGGGGVSFTASSVATLTASSATAVMQAATTAVGDVAYQRGTLGADINELTAAGNVVSTEGENLAAAQSTIMSTDYGQATSNMAKYEVLSETGIAALAQANSVQQEVLKLLQ